MYIHMFVLCVFNYHCEMVQKQLTPEDKRKSERRKLLLQKLRLVKSIEVDVQK